jgi:c-di-GMP-binding flagellar brake protein YcgR
MQERAHPRYAIELDAELVVDEGHVLRGRTRDISRGGFCMLVPGAKATLRPGAPSTVRLALVFSETEFSEQLTLPALIAWCTPLRGGVQIGVRFDNLDAAARNYLDLFMKFLADGAEDEVEVPPSSDAD